MKHSPFWILPFALAALLGCEDTGDGVQPIFAGAGAGGAAGSVLPSAGGGAGGAGASAAGMGGATAGMGGVTAGMGGAGAGGATGGMGGMGGAGGSTGPTGAPTFTAIFKEIMTVGSVGNCMFGGCHGAPPDPATNGNLRIHYMDQMGAYMNLYNVTSASTMCAGRKLVIPGDSANSLLIQKFSDTPPCGVKMPVGKPLTPAQVKQIADWIDMGAKND